MPTYAYKATDSSGKVVDGTLRADNENAAVRRLRELSYLPIRVSVLTAQQVKELQGVPSSVKGRIRRREVMWFTVQLATLLEAGITLDYSLGVLSEVAENEALKVMVSDLRKSIREGGTFSDGLAKYPKQFTPLYLNMVRAGEAGGALESVMANLAEFLEKDYELRSYVRSLMVYPAILLSFGGGAIVVLLTLVLPRFAKIFDDVGIPLPMPTQLLITASELFMAYWWIGVGLIFLSLTGVKAFGRTEQGRRKIDALKLRLPVLGPLWHKRMVARFSRTLASLLEGGVSMLPAFTIIKEIMQNKIMAEAIAQVQEGVKEGENIAQPLRTTGAFPGMAIHMITVGEETGQLERMLGKVADTYENETANTIRAFTSVLGPVLIVSMATLVGFIVLSVILPIMRVNELATFGG